MEQQSKIVEEYDVIIIGGGICGLYTAWRLATQTDLKLLVLEASERCGGRFMTIEMPGEFFADMGAMRYSPSRHPILHHLVTETNTETFSLTQPSADQPVNRFNYYMRNTRVKTVDELVKLYSISSDDLPHFLAANQFLLPNNYAEFDLSRAANGDHGYDFDASTGCLSKDMSVMQYLARCGNAELVNFGFSSAPPLNFQVAASAGFARMQNAHPAEARSFTHGFGELAEKLSHQLQEMNNVDLKFLQRVESISKTEAGMLCLTTLNKNLKKFFGRKIIYACGEVGLANIQVQGSLVDKFKPEMMLSKMEKHSALKLYLTYEKPWWQDFGLYQGAVFTDLPIWSVVAFGAQGTSSSYATILGALSSLCLEMFEEFDAECHERFVNSAGTVPKEAIPSKLLVEFVHGQLCQLLGCSSAPYQPVCAAKVFWGVGTREGVMHSSKIGVDSNKLHWESLKPVKDTEIYISGDTFPTWTTEGLHIGYAEASLLTSERILVNHFGLEPVVGQLCLADPFNN